MNTLIQTDPKDLTEKELQTALDLCETLTPFIKAINEFAYKRAMNGAKIGGRKLVQIRATEKWTGSPKFIDCDHNVLFNDPKPRTPKQVRAILKKDGRSEKEIARLVDEQCTKASSGLKLVSEEDRGVEVKVDAESVFTKTTKTN